MTKDSATQEPPTVLQLHSAREMRQPDKDGQIPHIFMTLSPDIPLAELTLDDILEVNWNGVKTSIQDAIVRVRHEGDLSSATVRDTIRLIALALKKLGTADADLGHRLANLPGLGFWGWLLAPWPTLTGGKLRKIVRDRRRMKRQRRELDANHDAIFKMRIELAGEIDRKLGSVLTARDPEYHRLHLLIQPLHATRATADGILDDLQRLAKYEVDLVREFSFSDTQVLDKRMKQIERKMPSFLAFCHRHGGEVGKRDDVELFVRELCAKLEAETEPIEQIMAAKREAMKEELYAEAGDSAP